MKQLSWKKRFRDDFWRTFENFPFYSGSRDEQGAHRSPSIPARGGRPDPRHDAGYCDAAMTTWSARKCRILLNSESEMSLTDVVCELCLEMVGNESRSAATKFWLGGGADSGPSSPPTPKFWFLLGFRPLYFENLEKSKNFGKLFKQISVKIAISGGTSPSEFWTGGTRPPVPRRWHPWHDQTADQHGCHRLD